MRLCGYGTRDGRMVGAKAQPSNVLMPVAATSAGANGAMSG